MPWAALAFALTAARGGSPPRGAWRALLDRRGEVARDASRPAPVARPAAVQARGLGLDAEDPRTRPPLGPRVAAKRAPPPAASRGAPAQQLALDRLRDAHGTAMTVARVSLPALVW